MSVRSDIKEFLYAYFIRNKTLREIKSIFLKHYEHTNQNFGLGYIACNRSLKEHQGIKYHQATFYSFEHQ